MSNSLVPSNAMPDQAVTLFDETNPASVLNMVPETVRKQLTDHLFTNPELFDKDEKELMKYLRSQERTPNTTDHRLRMKFWMEYDRATALETGRLIISNIYAGVCAKEIFANKYLENPHKVAWMLCPPASYMVKVEEGLSFGLDQLREMLELDHMPNGKFDGKLAAIKVKIVQMLEDRAKGAVVQKNITLQVGATASEMTSEALLAKLHELELKNKKAQNLHVPKPDIEVLPESAE